MVYYRLVSDGEEQIEQSVGLALLKLGFIDWLARCKEVITSATLLPVVVGYCSPLCWQFYVLK